MEHDISTMQALLSFYLQLKNLRFELWKEKIMNFGEQVKQLRKKNQITQQEMGERLGFQDRRFHIGKMIEIYLILKCLF